MDQQELKFNDKRNKMHGVLKPLKLLGYFSHLTHFVIRPYFVSRGLVFPA